MVVKEGGIYGRYREVESKNNIFVCLAFSSVKRWQYQKV
jgi:hypothetical protein